MTKYQKTYVFYTLATTVFTSFLMLAGFFADKGLFLTAICTLWGGLGITLSIISGRLLYVLSD